MTAEEIIRGAKLSNTHWGRRIIAAARRGRFRAKDKADAQEWTTCACGKQDPRLLHKGVPNDADLYILGCRFSLNVSNNTPSSAALTLVSIEERAGELLDIYEDGV